MYLDSGEYVGTAYVQEKPPFNTVIGEVRPRGGVNGLLLRAGASSPNGATRAAPT